MNKRFQMLFMFYPRFGSKVGKKCHFGQTINAWRSVWCHCPLLHWVGQIKKPLFCQQALKTQLQHVRLHESSASGHLKLKKKKEKNGETEMENYFWDDSHHCAILFISG